MGWKPADVSRRLKDLGYEAEESTVQVWESGRSPSVDNIEGLERIFGTTAPVEADDRSDLVAAIRELTAAVREVRQEQRQSASFLTELLALVAHSVGGEAALSQIADAVRAQSPATVD
jgi:hypothetical protein